MKLLSFGRTSVLLVSLLCGQQALATEQLSLKNLERERAALLADFLNPHLAPEIRANKIKMRERQLTDMERMVMRDDRLVQQQSALVKRAFDDYDLTFLVHAGAEQNKSASAQWLDALQLSDADLLNARAGYR